MKKQLHGLAYISFLSHNVTCMHACLALDKEELQQNVIVH